jgi:hypothetical protein
MESLLLQHIQAGQELIFSRMVQGKQVVVLEQVCVVVLHVWVKMQFMDHGQFYMLVSQTMPLVEVTTDQRVVSS